MGVILQQDDQAVVWGALLRDDREAKNLVIKDIDTAQTIQPKYDRQTDHQTSVSWVQLRWIAQYDLH